MKNKKHGIFNTVLFHVIKTHSIMKEVLKKVFLHILYLM